MGVITTGQTFASGDQVTATKLNDIANNCTFTSAADTTDNSTLTLSSGTSKLKVKDAGITSTQLANDSVITDRIQDAAVTAAKLAPAAVTAIMPTGSVIPFAGLAAAGPPAGWLFCDGGAQLQADQPALFAALGTTYGSTATTFNVPDLRGRVVAGRDDMGSFGAAGRLTNAGSGITGTTLGDPGGAETHLLTALESGLPAHNHTSGVRQSNNTYSTGSGNGTLTGTGINTGTVASAPATNAHNNVQPTIILQYIIKT